MKIHSLKNRTETGWSFSLQMRPFNVHGFWFDSKRRFVYPPKVVSKKGGYVDLVTGRPSDFERLRNLVEAMIKNGQEKHDTDTQPDPPIMYLNV